MKTTDTTKRQLRRLQREEDNRPREAEAGQTTSELTGEDNRILEKKTNLE